MTTNLEFWKIQIDGFINKIRESSIGEDRLEILCELEEQAINAIYIERENESTICSSDVMD